MMTGGYPYDLGNHQQKSPISFRCPIKNSHWKSIIISHDFPRILPNLDGNLQVSKPRDGQGPESLGLQGVEFPGKKSADL